MASTTYGNVIRGLRDVKITDISGATQEDLGAASGMEVEFILDQDSLEGDDVIYAVHTMAKGAEFTLMAGTYSSAVIEILTGITAVISGTTPNEINTMQFDQGFRFPYFKAYGQALDDGTGDLHVLLSKCKLTSLRAFALSNSEWRITEAEGIAIDDGTNGIVKSVQHETAATLPSS